MGSLLTNKHHSTASTCYQYNQNWKRMRVALALGDVAGSIVIRSVMVHFGEGLDWIDSFYLSDVTTVGYGGLIDHGRKTPQMLYENSA
jgi:hypothetical protein